MELKEIIITVSGIIGVFFILIFGVISMENYFNEKSCVSYGEMTHKRVIYKSGICYVQYGANFIPREELIIIRSIEK